MKVLLEGFSLPARSSFGGVESYWRELVPALLRQAPPGWSFALLSAFLHPRHARGMAAYGRLGAVLHHWWADPRWLRALGRLGARSEWLAGPHDLVHAMEPAWPFPTSGRLVLTCHDLMFHHHPQYLHPSWAYRLNAGLQSCLRRASFWICSSEYTREDLVRSFAVPRGRTTVVHPGVHPAYFAAREAAAARAGASNPAPYFLFVGSLEPKKNLPLLLEAFGRAVARGLASRLKIAGRAGYASQPLQELARRSPGLAERVDLLGFVAAAELPAVVAGAQALVLPSRFEGFGMPVLEAMAAGTPVLCSNRAALPEAAGGAALLFDPDDAGGLCELLLRTGSEPELRSHLGEAGVKRAAAFRWERSAAAVLAAYQRAAELPP